MLFEVTRTRREGRQLMRHAIQAYGVFTGHLDVQDEFHATLNRHVRTARLLQEDGQEVPGLAPLLDAVLLHVRQGYWVMGGHECPNPVSGGQQFAQSWVLIPAGE
jgi:hypothetical protein